jgi:hypothetical protein
MKRRLFALLLLACLAARAFAQTPTPQVTAIRAGRLIDPETGRESRNQIILVEGRKIKAVGPNVETPAGARVVDLSASTSPSARTPSTTSRSTRAARRPLRGSTATSPRAFRRRRF